MIDVRAMYDYVPENLPAKGDQDGVVESCEGFLVGCENMEDGDQVFFATRAEAEEAYSDDCCTIEPAPEGYDGPRWHSEESE